MSADESGQTLAQLVQRDHGVWEACAPTYEQRIVRGHPDVLAYTAFEEDLLDRLLLYLARDEGREVGLYDVGCGSGRLHLRYGRLWTGAACELSEPALASRLKVVSGLDFSAQMLELARRKLAAAGMEQLVGTRLLLEQGSAFELAEQPRQPLPLVVALCNTVGVMQGPAGASQFFAALRKAVAAGGIAMVSCYQREAVAAFALGNYESTMDVSGQPRWLVPADYAGEAFLQVPRYYKRAYDGDPTIAVDVYDRQGNPVREGHLLSRDPEVARETVASGHIRTYSDYESRWYGFEQIERWMAEHWAGASAYHLRGAQLDALRGCPAQLAFLDFSGLVAGFLERCGALDRGQPPPGAPR
ncbi:MAG: class I SAM-dependent methyltransferase [Deltaproteobacteria bacterium]|nr:class I SAM-dependent methyltransferase [Deltaproteobacteria bacterium]